PGVTEDLGELVRAAVQYRCHEHESGCGVDHPHHLEDLCYLVQRADLRAQRGEHVQGAVSRRLLRLLDGEVGADLALDQSAAVQLHRDVTSEVDGVAVSGGEAIGTEYLQWLRQHYS